MSSPLVPFVVEAGLGWAADRPEPPPDLLRVDPLRVASAPFIHRLKRLEAALHAPWGQVAPDWVFYDCALAPGALYGFALPASAVPEDLRAALAPDPLDGEAPEVLLPVALLVALPTARRGLDLVHTVGVLGGPPRPPPWLVSAAARTPRWQGPPEAILANLWRCAAEALAFPAALVTTPWADPLPVALASALGPLRIFQAWNPAHEQASTATLGVPASPHLAAPGAFPPHALVAVASEADLARLQARLAAGRSSGSAPGSSGETAWALDFTPGPGPLGGTWRVAVGTEADLTALAAHPLVTLTRPA
jgi:hypothetical protein